MEFYLILIIVAVVFVTFSAILRRYRRCPSDKILVIYGSGSGNGGKRSSTAVPPSSGPSSRTMPTST